MDPNNQIDQNPNSNQADSNTLSQSPSEPTEQIQTPAQPATSVPSPSSPIEPEPQPQQNTIQPTPNAMPEQDQILNQTMQPDMSTQSTLSSPKKSRKTLLIVIIVAVIVVALMLITALIIS
jgi:hypothetical protein